MGTYRYLDITAEVGIEAEGQDLRDAFASAGEALLDLMLDRSTVEEREQVPLEVSSPDPEALLVDWLNELIFLFDARHLALRRVEVEEVTPTRLRAVVYGERFDPARHRFRTPPKSATYHQVRVEAGPPARVRVVLDI